MKTKNIIIAVLFVALVGLCCFLGYRLHAQREFWKREKRLDISWHVGLFYAAQRGAYQKEGRDVRDDFGNLITDDLLVYQYEFGNDVGTNTIFAQKLADAKLIVKRVWAGQLGPIGAVDTNLPAKEPDGQKK